jgi:hypothetical protein
VPIKVPGLTGITAISAGAYHSVAVQKDGTVWVWGYNGEGQLGMGSTTDSHIPVRLEPLSGVRSAVAGVGYTLFLKGDGTVWGCGTTSWGQLGRTQREVVKVPLQIEGLSDVKKLSSYRYHGAAITGDGSVWVWGSNTDYQLGISSRNESATPVKVLPPAVEAPPAIAPPPPVSAAPAFPTASAVSAPPEPQTSVTPAVETTPPPAVEKPKLILVGPADPGKLQGDKYIYDGKVLIDDSDTIEWAALSPDRKVVAYKAEAKLKFFDIQKKKTTLVYTMTSDEYMGSYVMGYGFLPPYWIKFVGWAKDGKSFVVDKDYPGYFKGGTGYFQVNVPTGALTSIPEDSVTLQK